MVNQNYMYDKRRKLAISIKMTASFLLLYSSLLFASSLLALHYNVISHWVTVSAISLVIPVSTLHLY